MAGSIAPYESAWMVFARVMALNCLTWEELRRLLSLPSSNTARSGNDFLSGHWVAFSAYSSLLRERRTVLERGFPDMLGFPRCVSNTRGIRHCPECIRVGYHCTLFAIGALTHCPWHRVPLTRGCARCAMAVRTMDPHTASGGVICSECGTCIIDALRGLTTRADPELCQATEETGGQIVSWWRAVCEKEPYANDLLGDALGGAAQGHHTKLEWGGVNALASLPECWQEPVASTPAMIVKWPEPDEASALDSDAWEKSVIRHYRCVRRQVFRRFVRQHRRCLSILASAQRSDFGCLDREHVCTVCIAYIVWRRAFEQDAESVMRELRLSRLIEADYAHDSKREVRLLYPPQSCSDHWPSSGGRQGCRSSVQWTPRSLSLRGVDPSADFYPRLLYAEFLRLWMELEVDHIGANVKVIINPLTCGEFQLPLVIRRTSADQFVSEPRRGFVVLLPDARSLLDHANARCARRRSVRRSMFDAQDQWNADVFSWKGSEFPSPTIKLRCNHNSRIFDNIMPFPSGVP